jgi:hypothetical protein
MSLHYVNNHIPPGGHLTPEIVCCIRPDDVEPIAVYPSQKQTVHGLFIWRINVFFMVILPSKAYPLLLAHWGAKVVIGYTVY